MITIHKYELTHGENAISLPFGAKVISIFTLNDKPVLYAMVKPEAVKTKRIFKVITTGEEITEPMSLNFIGTIQVSGWCMLHVFEKI